MLKCARGGKEGIRHLLGVFVGVGLFFREKQLRSEDYKGKEERRLSKQPCFGEGKRSGRRTCCRKQRAKHQQERPKNSSFPAKKLLGMGGVRVKTRKTEGQGSTERNKINGKC